MLWEEEKGRPLVSMSSLRAVEPCPKLGQVTPSLLFSVRALLASPCGAGLNNPSSLSCTQKNLRPLAMTSGREGGHGGTITGECCDGDRTPTLI